MPRWSLVTLFGTEASALRRMRVLIADDQREVGTSLADLVRDCKHEIVGVVGSGLEAIQAYNKLHPDVVLMDYWMPKLNGATACRNILAKNPSAHVILVSGWSLRTTRAHPARSPFCQNRSISNSSTPRFKPWPRVDPCRPKTEKPCFRFTLSGVTCDE